MVDRAAARGVQLLVLPELWSCGYDPYTLPDDAPRGRRGHVTGRTPRTARRGGPPPRPLPRRRQRARSGGRRLYETVLAFNQRGALVACHRKTHLYPPTLEHTVFTPGDRLTIFDDPTLGVVGLVVGFEGDVPEVARVTLALRRARLVLVALGGHEVEAGASLGLAAILRWRWPTASGGCSRTRRCPTRRPRCSGASRIVAPTGTVVAEASAAVPGGARLPELLVHRIDLHLAYQREGVGALLEDEAAPASSCMSTGAARGCLAGRRQAVGRARRRGRRGPRGRRALRRSRHHPCHQALQGRGIPDDRCATSSSQPPGRRADPTASPSASSFLTEVRWPRRPNDSSGRAPGASGAPSGRRTGTTAARVPTATHPRRGSPAPCSTTLTTTEPVPVLILACYVPYRNHTAASDGASIYPACQNLLLAARALGYGGVMTSWQFAAQAELRHLSAHPRRGGAAGGHHHREAGGPARPRAAAATSRAGLRRQLGRRTPVGLRIPEGTTHTAAGPPRPST